MNTYREIYAEECCIRIEENYKLDISAYLSSSYIPNLGLRLKRQYRLRNQWGEKEDTRENSVRSGVPRR